jgi:hypothetical protein
MKPSTAGQRRAAARQAASAAATTSRGCSSFRLSAAEICAWYSQGSPGHIASCEAAEVRQPGDEIGPAPAAPARASPASRRRPAGPGGRRSAAHQRDHLRVMASGANAARRRQGRGRRGRRPRGCRRRSSTARRRAGLAVHQHAVLALLAVEELHAQLLAAAGVGGELAHGAEEVPVVAHLQRQAAGLRGPPRSACSTRQSPGAVSTRRCGRRRAWRRPARRPGVPRLRGRPAVL